MAAYKEAVPFLRNLEFEQVEETPFPVYKYSSIFLVISGIGKTLSAIAASYLITKYNRKVLFNIGSAGAAGNDPKVGDIFHIDRSIEFNDYAGSKRGHKELKPDVLDGFKCSSLSTHDRPVIAVEDRMKVSEYAELIDMEGASFIKACRVFSSKAYLFKIVTDTCDHNEGQEIVKNIKSTREAMFNFFMEKVYSEFIADK